MLAKCPNCGVYGSLELFAGDDAASKALLTVLNALPAGPEIIKYLGLFRPEKQQLSMKRTAKLLDEIMPMLAAKQITRNGVVYPASDKVWKTAINKVLDMRDAGKLSLPLKSHGYLFDVIVTESKRIADNKAGYNPPYTAGGHASRDCQAKLDLHIEQKQKPDINPAFKAQVLSLLKQAKHQAPLTADEKAAHLAALQTGATPPAIKTIERKSQQEILAEVNVRLAEKLANMTDEQRADYYEQKHQQAQQMREFNQQFTEN